jgi:DNA uptake protein ComE-like DNA-binding protein
MSRSFFNEYFHFTKGERTGTVILLILIVFILLITFLVPLIFTQNEVDFSEFEKEIERFQTTKVEDSLISTTDNKSVTENEKPRLFFFDPNSISGKDLELLGLNKKVKNTWLKYREKGGSFGKKEDLRKIYGLTDSVYYILEPYIVLHEKDSLYEEEYNLTPKQKNNTEVRFKVLPIIELNSADTLDLKKIRGIGSVYATRIIAYRELLGGFYAGEQLAEVYGLTPETVKMVLTNISVDTSLIRKINLNTASLNDLMRHPYLNRYQGKAILQYRKVQGGFNSVAEVRQNNLLPDTVFNKIRPYLTVEGLR